MNKLKSIAFITLFIFSAAAGAFAQQTGGIAGQVLDSLGAVVPGATVIAVDSAQKEKSAVSNKQGEYAISGLAPGTYTVRVIAPKFSLYENTEVVVAAGQKFELLVALTVQAVTEQVEVSNQGQVDNDPNSNASATVLTGKDIEALPDDPDELEAALQALAGPSAGPNGGQIYIDGFTGGRLPPRDTIREIRINQNPFSAEFDRLGFGRVEILTKPGSDKFRGSANFNFNDESLNSRNPFALNRAPSQTRNYGGNFSGPVTKGKSSFFFDINNREQDSGSTINALVLDSGLNTVPYTRELTIPTRRFSIGPRFDYAINDKNTIVLRYGFTRSRSSNQGIGDFSLPTRAYSTTNLEHEFRGTETAIINAKTVNETRASFQWNKREQTGDNTIPTINVASAFTGGGSQVGLSFNRNKQWEIQNYTTTSFGKSNQHAFKFGGRVRGVSISDSTSSNFGGSYTFINLTNYRDAILRTATPTQFNITAGNPLAEVNQFDVGLFVTDDWRISPALTLSAGLRYESQSNISDATDFAPRLSFAWSPGAGGAKQPKTVIRGGAGVFYDRFSENFTLNARRFDGVSQLNYVVSINDTDPVRRAAAIALLTQPIFTVSGVTGSPTVAQIAAALPGSSTIQRVATDLRTPYTTQATLGLERQLPGRTTLTMFYVTSRTINVLRGRNINAPVCATPTNCVGAVRPNPTLGNINYIESSGVSNTNQIIANFRTNFSTKVSLFGNYRLGFSNSNSDGAGSYPAYTYDLTGEYGRAGGDIRHNIFVGGSVQLPWNVRMSPFITASSGRPFNITTGVDSNGDTRFNERPTFAQLAARCTALGITKSFCDTAGNDPNATLPRNYGQGPKNFSVSLNLSRSFGFGKERGGSGAQGGGQSGNRGGGGGGQGGNRGGGGGGGMQTVTMAGGGGGGGPMMMMGGFGGGGSNRPYNLNVGVQISNLFNTVNLGTPIGNLASSRFGQSTSLQGSFGGFGPMGGGGSSGNRRIDLQLRFSW